jgi:methionyl-tRNA formyltransferase
MKIIFFGSSSFALMSLKAIWSSAHRVLAVVTKEDKPQGRNLQVQADVVKIFSQEKKIPVFQPANLKNTSFLKSLTDLKPDALVVVSYGKILPHEVLDIPVKMIVNLHPSLLPEYRGASPVPFAIWEGKTETGVTIARVSEKLDAGEIVLQEKVTIQSDEDAAALLDRLGEIGARLLVKSLDLIEKNKATLTPQDHSKTTYAGKLKKENGLIDWKCSAQKIDQQIRAMADWPSAFTSYKGKQLKILKAQPVSVKSTAEPATIIGIQKGESFTVQTGSGALEILRVQLEGKNVCSGFEFINGQRLNVGDKL